MNINHIKQIDKQSKYYEYFDEFVKKLKSNLKLVRLYTACLQFIRWELEEIKHLRTHESVTEKANISI